MEFLIVERKLTSLPLNKNQVIQDIPRSSTSTGQRFKLCYACKTRCITIDDYACEKCKMDLDNIEEPIQIDITDKLCQSCIERGYSSPRPATKMWTNGYYICEECYQPLLNNLLGGLPSHFSDIITSEDVLDNRDKIFNFHHQSILNYSQEELVQHLEDIKKILFYKRIEAESTQTLIDKYRAKNKVIGLDKSISESGKIPKGSSAAAKLKKSKEDKQIESLAKTLGMTVEQYKNLQKEARKIEFKGLLDGKAQSTESPKELDIDPVKGRDLSIPEAPKIKSCPLCKEIVDNLLAHYKICPKRQAK